MYVKENSPVALINDLLSHKYGYLSVEISSKLEDYIHEDRSESKLPTGLA